MHELSMANGIVETVLKEAKKRDASSVVEVRLVVGRFTMLGLEQLRYCYKLLTKNTSLEHSRLRIEREEGRIRCDSCGFEGPIQLKERLEYHLVFPTLECPECRKAVEMVSGRGCYIKSVRLKMSKHSSESYAPDVIL